MSYKQIIKDLAAKSNDTITPRVNFGGFFYVMVDGFDLRTLRENNHVLYEKRGRIYAKSISICE